MDAPRRLHGRHALLAALTACALLASACSAQPAAMPQQQQQQGSSDYATDDPEMGVSATMIALLAAVIAVFVLIAASIIYLRHCAGYSYAYAAGPSDRSVPDVSLSTFIARRLQRRTTRGLDAAVVEAFPTMRYAEAKALRVGKTAVALECAVCLSEFEDEERLRLLPRCSHAFHPDCIGEWLARHVTCPVCRCNLDPSKQDTGSDDEPANPPPPAAPEANSTSSEIAVVRRHQEDGAGPVSAAVVIDVLTDEEAEQRRKEAMELQRIGTQRRAMRSRPKAGTKKLVRSHSTGHSVAAVRLDRDLERFTLRLPEHLRREMIAAGEQRAGEGSSRGGRLGRSGSKWPTFLRYTSTLSGRFFSGPRRTDSSDGGEVSSSSSTRIRGKRVAAVDFADGSAVGGAKVGSVAVDVDKATSRQVRT
uniref:Uncharacterized protein n=1 Tax=Avena sativa TaxID=4498 RepID=A0ACD5ZJZ8_AVESA